MSVVVAGAIVRLAPDRYFPWDSEPFPDIDTSALSPIQASIVDALREEHEAQRPGTFYAEGIEEPWCADFVSWIMREADVPLSNPNSGSRRIPGVYTLQEYYEAHGRFEPVEGHVPAVGDVVVYDNDSWVGQHTNIVVAVDGSEAITVGGNEMGRVRVHALDYAGDSAVVGFGLLPS